ncbi:hypothetical protein ES702_02311 [subsurface metagenome]
MEEYEKREVVVEKPKLQQEIEALISRETDISIL